MFGIHRENHADIARLLVEKHGTLVDALTVPEAEFAAIRDRARIDMSCTVLLADPFTREFSQLCLPLQFRTGEEQDIGLLGAPNGLDEQFVVAHQDLRAALQLDDKAHITHSNIDDSSSPKHTYLTAVMEEHECSLPFTRGVSFGKACSSSSSSDVQSPAGAFYFWHGR